MNHKKKYLKNKKNHRMSCEYFKRCSKSSNKDYVKKLFMRHYKSATLWLKELNDKYYRIRADFRYVKNATSKTEYSSRKVSRRYKRSKAYYLRYVKNK